jgi:hypothetical protein
MLLYGSQPTNQPIMQLFIPAETMTAEEIQSFRDWARQNYTPLQPISGLWHPLVQAECTLMNEEAECTPTDYRLR